MARPLTAAALLLLALSLLAVAHCRPIEAEREESNAVVVAVSDENGAAENPTTLPAEAGDSATKVTVVQPAEEQEQQGGFLRLPSQCHRGPCRHGLRHRRHGWVRHQIFSGDADAPRRFRSRHGEERLAVLPAEEEVKAVAEPDPDRSLPDSDGEGELATTVVVPSFADADGARDADDEGAAAVRAWKKEMLRRWVHFHTQSHHGMRHHHRLHHGEQAAEEDEVAVAGEGAKRFHHRRHHDGEEEEDEEKEKTMRKRFRPAAEKHDDDSDDDEEVEEMVRRFRKAVTRRTRFGHGRRFHRHHHGHRHGEEAEKQAEGEEESGVMTWIKGLMNRF